jgi:isoquinoline 1-oxidoreductase
VDLSAAERLSGVIVVHQDDLVAVLSADPETAERALAAVQAEFAPSASALTTENVFDHLVRDASSPAVRDSAGDLEDGRAACAGTFDVTYHDCYLAHAPIEPHTALARFENGRLTIWSSTQTPFGTRTAVARATGLAPENVRVITPYVGGGFGGKSAGQQAVEAARLALITRRPVQVAWTRAEEFFHDTFRPAAVVTVVSGIDRNGKIVLWDYHIYGGGARGSEVFYDVPNRRVQISNADHPFATGPWRAPSANTNRLAAEQQIDIMARAAGLDPLAFRLANTTDPRMRSVLEAVGKASGWTSSPTIRETGNGRGLACGIDAGTYVALVADVTVNRETGQVKVDRVICAQEMGVVVNPDGARMQIEGCIAMGLGYTLTEELRFEQGRVLDTNFDTYHIPRFSWMPRIETVLVPNDALAPQGGGEPGIINVGAAVANAVYDATGARMTRLPMTPERVLGEIRKV